ncbi:MAG: ATP/GTP-binding protein [Leadbetterella sp.]|nr:ATP/GTP-binding protein [Leadbetterella sp.]
MKHLLTTTVLALGLSAAQAQTITKIWQTDSTLATPESVLPVGDQLYVSLIDGAGWDADGKGGIAVLDKKGALINGQWVTGLHAPKGMALVKGILYVADITEIVSIDFRSGKILEKHKVEGAVALNDVTADARGTVYVSDSRTGKLLTYKKGKAEVYLENLKDINGLKWHKGKLYITANQAFIEHDPKTGTQREICKLENGGDGVEPYQDGFFVTAWSGYLYHVDARGNRKTLRETHQTNKFKTADIGLDPEKGILYIPTFFGNTVEAWKIQK